MSWDNDIYYAPEENGLEIVMSHDFSSGFYVFDYRVIWREVETGRLLTARDSGCSCPSPFEDFKVEDLSPFNHVVLIDEAREEQKEDDYDGDNIAEYVQKLRELGKENVSQ